MAKTQRGVSQIQNPETLRIVLRDVLEHLCGRNGYGRRILQPGFRLMPGCGRIRVWTVDLRLFAIGRVFQRASWGRQ